MPRDGKAAPSAPAATGRPAARPLSSTSEIARAPRSARVSDWPSLTADADVKVRLPNCEIGNTRRRANGASSIHSAELSDEAYCTVRCSVWPEVRLVNEISQVSPACWSIETLTESPGQDGQRHGVRDVGSISIHAW